MRAHSKRIILGVALLLAAAFLVLDQLHLVSVHIGFWSVVWTVVFAVGGIYAIMNKSISGTVFSIAFLLIIYAKELHIQRLVPWTILLAGLLISIGLNMVFKRNFKPDVVINGKKVNMNWSDLKNLKADFTGDSDEINGNYQTDDGENVVISTKMGDVSRYIHSDNLRSINVHTSMGDVKVYLDDVKTSADKVYANVDVSMGDVTFYIPKNWKVRSNLSSGFGDINVPNDSQADGPTFVLQGRTNMGDITVKYV
ncbi:LiaF transmembrane domain-containing protein [uncultured Lactobacillus sp.]|uniref:LiaF transmembrane domain-containing protein n=1 Tax=uncultured Lactobacillus sp. TaxID=153152 RepID=UPI0026042F25|nr:LiaF domain-containing protein [uncultured Lactobacillus sp.]